MAIGESEGKLVLELSDDLIALPTNPLDGVLVEAGNSLTAVV
jgi:hypothetical protein